MASEAAIQWDDEEILSEWAWDDDGFAEYDQIIQEHPELKHVEVIVEEKDL